MWDLIDSRLIHPNTKWNLYSHMVNEWMMRETNWIFTSLCLDWRELPFFCFFRYYHISCICTSIGFNYVWTGGQVQHWYEISLTLDLYECLWCCFAGISHGLPWTSSSPIYDDFILLINEIKFHYVARGNNNLPR